MDTVVILRGVEVRYDQRVALHEISLRVGEGETLGIVGRNGAGKTTLLSVLVGLRRACAGSVRVCGFDPSDRHEVRSLRRAAGIVFQNCDDQLFAGTVFDDVAFGPLNLDLDDETVRRRVDQALERVGAGEHAQRISHHLSAGEKRRVALATALAMEPDLLILDEPTSGLDPQGRRMIIDLLSVLRQTKVIATHDLEFVLETCTRVVILDAGGIAAEGAPQVLLADETLMLRTGLEVPHSLR